MRAAVDAFGPGGGDVVNTASLAGLGPVPGYGVYAATKAAVVSITGSVDAETPAGVRCHAVCPDVVDTAMLTEGHTQDSLGSRIAHSGGRVLTAEEVARHAVSLVGSRRVVLVRPGLAGRASPGPRASHRRSPGTRCGWSRRRVAGRSPGVRLTVPLDASQSNLCSNSP